MPIKPSIEVMFVQNHINPELAEEVEGVDFSNDLPKHNEMRYYVALRRDDCWLVRGFGMYRDSAIQFAINTTLIYHIHAGWNVDAIAVLKVGSNGLRDTVEFAATKQDVIDALEFLLAGLKGE